MFQRKEHLGFNDRIGESDEDRIWRLKAEGKIRVCRVNLLIVVLLTLLNCLAVLMGMSNYFFFSAFLPYRIVLDGVLRSGMYAIDGIEVIEVLGKGYLAATLGIGAVILAIYLVLTMMIGKKRIPGLVASTVFFAFDCIYLLVAMPISTVLLADYLFHAWVMFYLISALIAAVRLEKNASSHNSYSSAYVDLTDSTQSDDTEGAESVEEIADDSWRDSET